MATTVIDAKSKGDIEALLVERHGAYLTDERFQVMGHIEGDLVWVAVVLRSADDSLFYPVEMRIDKVKARIKKVADVAKLLLDFADYYFGEYLSGDRDVYLPIDWAEIQFGPHTLEARGQEYNLKIERMADELLGGDGIARDLERRFGS